MQGKDRLKAFPKWLKLSGDSFIQSPVNNQLEKETNVVKVRKKKNKTNNSQVVINNWKEFCNTEVFISYPEIFFEVVDRDRDVFATLF